MKTFVSSFVMSARTMTRDTWRSGEGKVGAETETGKGKGTVTDDGMRS